MILSVSHTVDVISSDISLHFVSLPGYGRDGELLAPAVAVEVRDGGTVVTIPLDIRLSLASGDGVLEGPTTATTVDGRATFPGLRIRGHGLFSLRAEAEGADPVVSSPIRVLAQDEDGPTGHREIILPTVAVSEGRPYPIDRYQQLLEALPRGEFYLSDGVVLPYTPEPTDLRVVTDEPNTRFGLFINESHVRDVHTDGEGVATVLLPLPLGRCDIVLESVATRRRLMAWVTTREYAVWYEAYAKTLGDKDLRIEDLLRYSRLGEAPQDALEETWGRKLRTPNPGGYDTEAYRELLQQLASAYRYHGSSVAGWDDVVAAYCQNRPKVYKARDWRAWVLDGDLAVNPSLNRATRPVTMENAAAAGVRISVSGDLEPGTWVQVQVRGVPPAMRVAVVPPAPSTGWLSDYLPLDGGGRYEFTLPDVGGIASEPGPFQVESGKQNLSLLVDGERRLDVQLPEGALSAESARDHIYDVMDVVYGGPRAGVVELMSIPGPPGSSPQQGLLLGAWGTDVRLLAVPGDAAPAIFGAPASRGELAVPLDAGSPRATLVAGHTLALSTAGTIDLWIASPLGHSEVLAAQAGEGDEIEFDVPPQYSYPAGSQVVPAHSLYTGPRGDATTVVVEVDDEEALLQPGPPPLGTVGGVPVPDGTLLRSATPHRTPYGQFGFVPDGSQGEIWQQVSPEISRWQGTDATAEVRLAFLGQPSATAVVQLGVSYDDGATWEDADPESIDLGSPQARHRSPHDWARVAADFTIPEDCSRMWVRARVDAGPDVVVLVGQVSVLPAGYAVGGVGAPSTGRYLARGTVARREHSSKRGEMLMVWSPEALSGAERQQLGLDGRGHLQNVAPAHSRVFPVDVTEYDVDGVPTNLVGAWDEEGFDAGEAVGLEIVLRSPARQTYLRPKYPSAHRQVLKFDAETRRAILEFPPAARDHRDMLFENGVPLPYDEWGMDSDEVVLAGPVDPRAVYEISYRRELSFTTSVIDLGPDHDQHTWWVGWHVRQVPQGEMRHIPRRVQLLWSDDLIARVEGPADVAAPAQMYVNDGQSTRPVNRRDWDWYSQDEVRLRPEAADSSGIYTLEYRQLRAQMGGTVGVRTYLSSGDDPETLGPWVEVEQDQVVAGRYHRMRVELDGVVDLSDAELRFAGIRGIRSRPQPPAISIVTDHLAAILGVPYEGVVSVTGGRAPLSFSIVSGSLPAGLHLDPASGSISGLPTEKGTSTFTLRVEDMDGRAAERTYDMRVGEVLSLLHFEGPEGSTTFHDETGRSWSHWPPARITTDWAALGESSYFPYGPNGGIWTSSFAEIGPYDDFTVQFFYVPLDTTADFAIFDCRSAVGAPRGFLLTQPAADGTTLACYFGDGEGNEDMIGLPHQSLTEGVPVFVTVRRRGSVMEMFLDGELKDSAEWSQPIVFTTGTSSLGNNKNRSRWTRAYIDEFRVVGGAAVSPAVPAAPFPTPSLP